MKEKVKRYQPCLVSFCRETLQMDRREVYEYQNDNTIL